jgi:hypothetical protein
MKFPLTQLYVMNRSKPLVRVDDTGEWLQWDTCDLEGLPPERVGTRGGTPTMTDMGKPAPGQWDNLPEVFVSTDGDLYKIKDIHSLMPSK